MIKARINHRLPTQHFSRRLKTDPSALIAIREEDSARGFVAKLHLNSLTSEMEPTGESPIKADPGKDILSGWTQTQIEK